jgi:hypothetical protein
LAGVHYLSDVYALNFVQKVYELRGVSILSKLMFVKIDIFGDNLSRYLRHRSKLHSLHKHKSNETGSIQVDRYGVESTDRNLQPCF